MHVHIRACVRDEPRASPEKRRVQELQPADRQPVETRVQIFGHRSDDAPSGAGDHAEEQTTRAGKEHYMLEQWTAFTMSMDEDLGYDLSPPVTAGAAGA